MTRIVGRAQKVLGYQIQLATLSLKLDVLIARLERRYRSDQPRSPKGTPEGGRGIDDLSASIRLGWSRSAFWSRQVYAAMGFLVGAKTVEPLAPLARFTSPESGSVSTVRSSSLDFKDCLSRKYLRRSVRLIRSGARRVQLLSRTRALHSIKVGDVIFGIAEGGQPKLLLVYEADSDSFFARHVTSQTTARFGRDGKSTWVMGGGSCVIVSTAQLPSEMYETALGLDRKWASKPEFPASVLSQAEIKLLTTHRAFFEAHTLPAE